MAAQTFKTANAAGVAGSIRQLWLVLLIIMLLPTIGIGIAALAHRDPKMMLPLLLAAILCATLPLSYATGYKRLLVTIDETGLTVRFLRTLWLEWREIQSVERVDPRRVVKWRLGGLCASGLLQGLFSLAGGGRAWVWLADENEALLLRTTRRNYIIAPERIDEAERLIRERISVHAN